MSVLSTPHDEIKYIYCTNKYSEYFPFIKKLSFLFIGVNNLNVFKLKHLIQISFCSPNK